MTSEESANTPPAGRAEQSRARLLAAAAEVIVEEGYDGAGVAEIARRADLTTGAIYGKFSGKSQLLAAAIEAQMTDELTELLDGPNATTITELMGSLGASLVEPDGLVPGLLLLEAFAASQREDDLREVIVGGLDEEGRRLGKLIDEGKTDGLVDPEIDTASIVTLCHSISLGFMLLRSVEWGLPEPKAWGALIDRLISVAPPLAVETTELPQPTDSTNE